MSKYIAVHCAASDVSTSCYLSVEHIVSIHVHESPDGGVFGVWVFTTDGRYMEVNQAESTQFMRMLENERMI